MEYPPALTIRSERPADVEAIAHLTQAAFTPMPYASHTEQFIVAALRQRAQLAVSLVAVEASELVGHVAISPVTISTGAAGWYGLGPLSVAPAHQRHGIGTQLVLAALAALRRQQALGCVLLGDPTYYGRFGFRPETALVLPGASPAYFQVLSFTGTVPTGTVRFDAAFEAKA